MASSSLQKRDTMWCYSPANPPTHLLFPSTRLKLKKLNYWFQLIKNWNLMGKTRYINPSKIWILISQQLVIGSYLIFKLSLRWPNLKYRCFKWRWPLIKGNPQLLGWKNNILLTPFLIVSKNKLTKFELAYNALPKTYNTTQKIQQVATSQSLSLFEIRLLVWMCIKVSCWVSHCGDSDL